jgi:hypothetical protein
MEDGKSDPSLLLSGWNDCVVDLTLGCTGSGLGPTLNVLDAAFLQDGCCSDATALEARVESTTSVPGLRGFGRLSTRDATKYQTPLSFTVRTTTSAVLQLRIGPAGDVLALRG